MQAIRTKYFPPTNSRGARIQAKCEAKAIFVSWDHSEDIYGNHLAACRQLQSELDWGRFGTMVGGMFGEDYYWVFKS